MLLELCLIIGGVIFFKNRKKRRAEEAARQEWYNSGRTGSPPPPPPQGYPPYNGNQDPSMQKPPVVYGNSQQPPSPQYPPVMSGPTHVGHSGPDAPPDYASLMPQSQALGYERQNFYTSGERDQKGGSIHRP